MTRLEWNAPGERLFEAGVDRGVLYVPGFVGVPWNGLISVKESSTGGAPTPYYLDGVKYLNRAAREEFQGTIDAFASPEVFDLCDGTISPYRGLSLHQQKRLKFNFCYRTGVGNDVDSLEHGYQIHLVYNALAAPSTRDRGTWSDSTAPMTLSWAFTTSPDKSSPEYRNVSHISFNSTKIEVELLNELESILYGDAQNNARMLTLAELLAAFHKWETPLEIIKNEVTGIGFLQPDGLPDLNGNLDEGIYFAPRATRLRPTEEEGIYRLDDQ